MTIRVKPRSKYRAVPTVVDGIRFDSKKEATRYRELKLLEMAGEIRAIGTQTTFDLTAGRANERLGEYRADFTYYDTRAKELVVEDVKGHDTPLSKWKRRHVRAQYGIDVRII